MCFNNYGLKKILLKNNIYQTERTSYRLRRKPLLFKNKGIINHINTKNIDVLPYVQIKRKLSDIINNVFNEINEIRINDI